jgi:hypothetical protein
LHKGAGGKVALRQLEQQGCARTGASKSSDNARTISKGLADNAADNCSQSRVEHEIVGWRQDVVRVLPRPETYLFME